MSQKLYLNGKVIGRKNCQTRHLLILEASNNWLQRESVLGKKFPLKEDQ